MPTPILMNMFLQMMGARLWTRGWDFFIPRRNIVSHLYYKRDATVYVDNAKSTVGKSDAWKRLRYLLGRDKELPPRQEELEHLGLGTTRSIDEYWEFVGMDWSVPKINNRCKQVYDYVNKKWLPNPDPSKQ